VKCKHIEDTTQMYNFQCDGISLHSTMLANDALATGFLILDDCYGFFVINYGTAQTQRYNSHTLNYF